MKFAIAISLVVASILVSGCQKGPAEEEDAGQVADAPKAREFKGSVDPKLAGVWKPEKGTVTLNLNPDGTMLSEGKVSMGHGSMDVHTVGKWLVDGQDLLIASGKDQSSLNPPVTYKWTLEGDKLSVKIGKVGPTTVYKRSGSK